MGDRQSMKATKTDTLVVLTARQSALLAMNQHKAA
jgi:hypothetical protein